MSRFILYLEIVIISCFFLFSEKAISQISFVKHHVATFNRAFPVVSFDVDMDGDVDILCGGHFGAVAWWRNSGSQSFTQITVENNFSMHGLFLKDLDKDGDTDIVGAACDVTGGVVWWENRGGGSLSKHMIDTDFYGSESVFAADLDNDGDIDVVSVSIYTNKLYLYKNNGSQSFSRQTVHNNFNGGHHIHGNDLDGDGDIDLVTASSGRDGTGPVMWWRNNGGGNFSSTIISGSLGSTYCVHSVDIDSDGDYDILGASHGSEKVVLWKNKGNGSFSMYDIDSNLDQAIWVQAGDMDNDGDLDVVASGRKENNKLMWYENKGGTNFSKHTIDDSNYDPRPVIPVDMDGDGDLDLVVTYEAGHKIIWWESIKGQNSEYVSNPNTPTGPASGNIGVNLEYSTGGSSSSYGHSVEYQFDWGDGEQSSWGSATKSHSYSNFGNYLVRARARCESDNNIVSGWSNSKSVTISNGTETVSITNVPTGPSSGSVGQNLNYSTSGSTSSLGHAVDYQFDWGDGNVSGWGDGTGSHSYSNSGSFQVRARARCETHTYIVSDWSGGKTVSISGSTGSETVSIPYKPTGPSTGLVGERYYFTTGGSVSNLEHSVEYQFDWGNGIQTSWNGSTRSRIYYGAGNFQIRTRARCKTHTEIISGWSDVKSVTIADASETVSTPDKPSGPSSGFVGDNLSFTTGGAESSSGHDVQYQFDWGNGIQSSWNGSIRSIIYNSSGNFQIRIRARCKTHTEIMSDWSDVKSVTLTDAPETVSTPDKPSGPSSGIVGENLTFLTDGAVSNFGHDVQYQFDWGNGQQSAWGANTGQYSYAGAGTYQVRARARCAVHTDIISGWSETLAVIISPNQYEISGSVRYYSNQNPVQNVSIAVPSNAANNIVSSENGEYEFLVGAGDSFKTIASKQFGEHVSKNDITVYDAVLAARYVYQYETLTSGQQLAADADQNGSISLYDAVLIARFAIDLTNLESGFVNNWIFIPNERIYQDIQEDKTNQDFTGYIVGNVHGGWTGTDAQRKNFPVFSEYNKLNLIKHEDQELVIPLYIDGMHNVFSADIEIVYNYEDLKFARYEKSELTNNFEAVINAEQQGKFRMGLYSAKSIKNDGNLINIIFQIKDETKFQTEIKLTKFQLNNTINKSAVATVNLNNKNSRLTNFKLHQNYPNPFNSGTIIRFEIPGKDVVVINIYNELGQIIKTLLNEVKEPGEFAISWDGTNNQGVKEQSGIKFYKIIYKNNIQVRKMLLLN